MLRKFTVENYKNFKDPVTIDFTDVKKYNFNTECIKNNYLNKALIMGNNGSGKTNLAYGLFDIVYTLTDNNYNEMQILPEYFLNGFSTKNYATFTYEFENRGDVIRYEYRKKAPKTIIYESLTINDETIFINDRVKNNNDYTNLSKINAETLQFNLKTDQLSLLKFIASNTIQEKGSPISFIINFVSNMLYFRSLQDNSYIGLMKNGENLEQFIVQNKLVKDFQNFINEYAHLNMKLEVIHTPISDMLVERYSEKKILPFTKIASSGTRALMLFYYWVKHSKNITFLYIDEFDAFYHYDLAESILKKMISENNFQTILTSHNTDLVDNSIMRPDCYLILANGKVKSMPELTDRELREGHSLRKLLRGGEFDE